MTDTTKPFEITPAEWQEIIQVPEVREGWGLDDDETAEEFSQMVYGVKVHYVTDGPEYAGDLFILQGGTLDGPPLMLIRNAAGTLQMTMMMIKLNAAFNLN